jgi:acyl-CoA synthetase (AMP-forming)/AMP-acid ligase II
MALRNEPHVCLPLCTLLQRPEQPDFVRCDNRSLSSWQFVRRIAGLSAGLSHLLHSALLQPPQHNPQPAVVMIAALNTDAMLEALLGVCDAGCIATPINHRWSAAELAAAMQLTRPRAILADGHCSHLALAAIQLLAQQQHYTPPTFVPLGHSPQPLQAAEKPSDSHYCNTECSTEQLIADWESLAAGRLQLRVASAGSAMIVFTSGTTGMY